MDPPVNQPKAAKKAKKRICKKKKVIKKKRTPYTGPLGPPIKFEVFNIFPEPFFTHPRLAFTMCFFTKGVKQQEEMLELYRKNPFQNSNNPVSDTLDSFWSPSFVKGVEDSLQKVRRARFILRQVIHHWRFKRLIPSNTEDIVTLSIPKHPVWIVDWPLKKKYVFEGSTLMRDITARLLEYDGFFEDPQPPRNPLTNLPLTQAQTISIWNQLSTMRPSAAFTEFRRVRFSIDRYLLEYNIPLQLYAFKQTMKDPKHLDTQERLLDFIEYAYDQESIDCFIQSYKYAMEHYSDHEILAAWTKACVEFYEAGILYSRSPQRLHDLQEVALNKTTDLLPRQDELRLLRNSDMRLRRTTTARRTREVVYQREVTILAGRTVEEAAAQISELLNTLL
jgi:hypothetical protein